LWTEAGERDSVLEGGVLMAEQLVAVDGRADHLEDAAGEHLRRSLVVEEAEIRPARTEVARQLDGGPDLVAVHTVSARRRQLPLFESRLGIGIGARVALELLHHIRTRGLPAELDARVGLEELRRVSVAGRRLVRAGQRDLAARGGVGTDHDV